VVGPERLKAERPALKVALGLSDPAQISALVLQEGTAICLAGGLWLRRAKVMDRYRMEVVGGRLAALGCFSEIIAYTLRVFVPVDQADVLAGVLAKWPPQSVLPKAA